MLLALALFPGLADPVEALDDDELQPGEAEWPIARVIIDASRFVQS
jgi:hypothetical protein